MRRAAAPVLLLAAAGLSVKGQPPAVFRSGVRLVEVDAVVRDKNGAVTGLTRDDFALYDCSSALRNCKGKRQQIDVFREVNLQASALQTAPAAPRLSLPEGSVSNRAEANGQPVSTATVILIDQLNTPFELKAYERTRITEFLKSIGDHNRIALYSLGQDLHIIQDFTDDPQTLIDAVAHLDSGGQVDFAKDDGDTGRIGGVEAAVEADLKFTITSDAIQAIVRHMAGVLGRKSLVWISQGFPMGAPFQPPKIGYLLGQANIAVYPVMVRSLMGSGAIASSRRGMPAPGAAVLGIQYRTRNLGESLGGEGFDDASQALAAVNAAEADSKNYYVLGFYPADADLDGAMHQLTLEVAKAVSKGRSLTLQYRQVYLAAKPGKQNLDDSPTLTDLLLSPLDASEIGLTAMVQPDPTRPGNRQIRASIDLRDLNLQREGDRWTGSLKLSARLSVANKAPWTLNRNLDISLTDAELEARRDDGLAIAFGLPDGFTSGSARIVVQNVLTGAAGSLRVAIPEVPSSASRAR